MSEQQPRPEYVWVFPPERKRNARRLWLIVGLSVLAAAIAVLVFWLFVQPGAPAPVASPSPTPTASATPSPTPTPSTTPTRTPSPAPSASSPPSATDAPTPPKPVDPSIATFRDQVAPVLDSASTGLGYAREEGGMAAMQDVMLLQDDAGRLSGR